MDGRSVDISLADADKSIYKLSDRPAETIRRPHRTNDAWEVIKKGSWKLVSFFIWQTRSTRDRLKGPSRAAKKLLALQICSSGRIGLLCGYTFIKNPFQCLGWYMCQCMYTGSIKLMSQSLHLQMSCRICLPSASVNWHVLCVCLEWYNLNHGAAPSTHSDGAPALH